MSRCAAVGGIEMCALSRVNIVHGLPLRGFFLGLASHMVTASNS